MKEVRVWFVNHLHIDGMPGTNKYYSTEKEARAGYQDATWQRIGSFMAVEIEGEIYRKPLKIDFD